MEEIKTTLRYDSRIEGLLESGKQAFGEKSYNKVIIRCIYDALITLPDEQEENLKLKCQIGYLEHKLEEMQNVMKNFLSSFDKMKGFT